MSVDAAKRMGRSDVFLFARRTGTSPAALLLLVVAVGVAVGVDYVLRLKGYFVMPDELTYQRDALYIAQHARPVPSSNPYYNSPSQLASLIQAPVWALTSAVGVALDSAHILNVVIFSTSCVPIFLLVRRIAGGTAVPLLAGAASVAVPWFVMTGTLMTEPVAYCAFCWALLGMQRAVAQPTVRHEIVALVGVLLAVGARSQLVFLGAVYVLAVVLREVVVRDSSMSAIVRRHTPLLTVLGLAAAVALVTGAGANKLIGNYEVTSSGGIFPAGTWSYARELLTSVGVACAGITLPLAIAWAIEAAGRPRELEAFAGALVLGLAGIAAVVIAGAFSVRFTAGQNDRYVAYVAPVLFAASAAALSRGPLRPVPLATSAVAAGVIYWTSTLAAQGPSLASPGGAFRVVVDGRSRQLTEGIGLHGVKPTAVVAVLVGIGLAVIWGAARHIPQRAVAVAVGIGVLVFGAAETRYTVNKIAQTQAGASPEFVASRGWADRALPAGAKVNALIGSLGDAPTTIGVWWDVVFYNRRVERVYQPAGAALPQQPADPVVTVDTRTGAIRGLPSGYVIAVADAVDIGIRGDRPIARFGPLEMLRVGTTPHAAFLLQTPNADGAVPEGKPVELWVFGDATGASRTLTLSAVARTGPLRLAIDDAHGRRVASAALAKDVPRSLRFTLPASSAAMKLNVRATAPANRAQPGALAQTLGVHLETAE